MTIERGLVTTRLGQVHYRAAGTGDAIMLFHINQQSSALNIELIEALAPSFRAIAMDYPSYGMSDHVAEPPAMRDYADCAADVLDALGCRSTYVLGEAVGSAVATEFARSRPERALGAILLNCPLMRGRAEAAAKIGAVRAAKRPTDASGFPVTRDIGALLATDPEHAPLAPTQSWMDRINVAQIEAGRERWQAAEALIAYDFRSALRALACPVLLLTAEHGPFASARAEVEACIPSITSRTVERARFSMGWEHAAEIGARVAAFRAAHRDISTPLQAGVGSWQ